MGLAVVSNKTIYFYLAIYTNTMLGFSLYNPLLLPLTNHKIKYKIFIIITSTRCSYCWTKLESACGSDDVLSISRCGK